MNTLGDFIYTGVVGICGIAVLVTCGLLQIVVKAIRNR